MGATLQLERSLEGRRKVRQRLQSRELTWNVFFHFLEELVETKVCNSVSLTLS